jgi:sec-independent protein translocase protein TatC
MPRKSDEDLFRESTMTFGEHLEELRSALFMALLWVVGGFLIGLGFAKPAVKFIQGPVEGALEEHYKGQAKAKLQRLEEGGITLPGTVDQLTELVADRDVLPEEVYFDPGELERELERVYKDLAASRKEGAQLLRDAESVLERVQRPAAEADRKLTADERNKLTDAARLLHPPEEPTDGSAGALTRKELTRILAAIEGRQQLPPSDATRLFEAIRRLRQRVDRDLARLRTAIDSLSEVHLPRLEPHESLQGKALARVFLWHPIENDPRIQTKALGVSEGFMIYIKAALLVGVLVAAPGIFWHIWAFVASGLYTHERRFVKVFGPFSLALFFAGAALVFFFVFQMVLRFLFWFNEQLGIGIEPRITEWLGFVLILPIGFGIAFQLPLVMLFLERIGVFDVQTYLSKWRIAVLVIAVLSMLLTPADPGSMMMMGVPLTVLYFGGILLCRFMPRSRSPYDEEEDEKDAADAPRQKKPEE